MENLEFNEQSPTTKPPIEKIFFAKLNDLASHTKKLEFTQESENFIKICIPIEKAISISNKIESKNSNLLKHYTYKVIQNILARVLEENKDFLSENIKTILIETILTIKKILKNLFLKKQTQEKKDLNTLKKLIITELGYLLHDYNNKVLEIDYELNTIKDSTKDPKKRLHLTKAINTTTQITRLCKEFFLNMQTTEDFFEENAMKISAALQISTSELMHHSMLITERFKKHSKTNTELEEKIDILVEILESYREIVEQSIDPNKIEKERIKVSTLVEKALKQSHANKTKNKNIQIETEINEEEVIGNLHRLIRVVTNLINNALTAIHKNKKQNTKGKIEIKSKQFEEEVLICISDNGIGIAEEIRDKIFQKSFSTNSSQHNGLGLSYCAETIKLLNGEIEAENKVNSKEETTGAIFTITLPSAKKEDI